MTSPRPIRGELWTVFLDGQPLEGEPAYFRPVIVLQNGQLFNLSTRMVVAVYSSSNYLQHKGNVSLPRGEGGVESDSAVVGHQVRTLNLERFRRRLGRVSEQKLTEIEGAVLYCLGIGS